MTTKSRTGETSSYFKGKLFDINYAIATHEGTAKARLRSVARKILVQLSQTEVPERYQKQFLDLRTLIRNSLSKDLLARRHLRTFVSIHNTTAAKYIRMLLDMQYYLEEK
jgi:hypothetical protein